MRNKLAGLYLLTVAALWGLTFPLIELTVGKIDPYLFVSLRFTLAALPLIPYFLKNLNKTSFRVGAALGVMHCGAFLFQTIGVQTLNASRAAFLTGIYVLMIPFMSPFLKMGFPKVNDLISGAVCCGGVYILTECNIGAFSLGDTWILVADFFIAASIIYIGKHSQDDMDPNMLAYGQIVMTGLFSWVPTFIFSEFNFVSLRYPTVLTSLFVCSFLATILAIKLQSKYQRYVSIQSTALIFSLEPVFAAVFDTLITRTPPKIYTLIGGLIILSGILYLELSKGREKATAAN